jgi:hypothetical protein
MYKPRLQSTRANIDVDQVLSLKKLPLYINIYILYSLFLGTYQVDMSQLQMVIAGYITIMNMPLQNSYISAMRSPIWA